MSLRRNLRRASGILILGICMLFASVLPQGGLSAQTAPKAADGSGASAQEQQKIAASAIKIPLFFEANAGQTDPSVRFLTRSGGYTMFLTPTETVLVEGKNGSVSGEKFGKGFAAFRADTKNSKQPALRMELLGANSAPEFQGLQELPGKVNYLIGKDQAAWHTNVALFSEVQVTKVYPGVDLLFHGDQRQLEYDFVVAPGADAGRIGFKIRGAKKIEIDANGNLILHTGDSEFEMRKPVIYQGEGTSRSEVRGKFVLSAKNEVRFELGPYDHAEKLVIDPAIDYATFLGGAGVEISEALAVDSSTPGAPKIYTTGATSDLATFPEGGTRINNPTGDQNLYIAKIDPTKTGSASLVYLTFIGGSTAFESAGQTTCETEAAWLALDQSQGASLVEPVIGGETNCADYPGSFITPTVSGVGAASAVAAVVTRLASTGTAIDKSVLLGGNGEMSTAYVFVDASGNVLASGGAASTNLPTTAGAYVSTFNNGATGAYDDCYTAKLQRSDLMPVYFSYLNMGAGSTGPTSPSGAQETACGGVIDSNNPNILYFGGNTFSTVAFAGAPDGVLGFQPTFQGTKDAFVMKLDISKSGAAALQYATYIGGGGVTEVNTGAHQLGTGLVVLAGRTTSSNSINPPDIPLANSLPGGTTNAAADNRGNDTGFLTVTDTTKSGAASLVSGSYFGGSSGADGIRSLGYDSLIPNGFYIIVGGTTQSTDFPILHPFQAALTGTQDGFVAAFFITPTTAVTEFSTYIGGGVSDELTGVDIDSNHAIYGTATTTSATFFGNTSPATTVNGFQTTCTSCNVVGAPAVFPDATVFALTSAASATFTAQISVTTTTLAVGSTEQLNVLGTYSDGTFQDLTSKVTWNSSNPSAATISSGGLVSAVGAGMTTTISATLAGTTIPSITITVPAVTGLPFNVVLEGTAYGTVTDNLGQINCTNIAGQGTTGTCNTTYPTGTQVILTQTANPGSVFATWGTAIGDAACPGPTATCTFTMDEQEEITATFNNGTGNFALNVIPGANATGGGTVTGNIGGTGTVIQCVLNGVTTPTGVCTQNILSGSITTLTAIANGTSNFTGWSGPCVVPTAQPAKCVVTMGAAKTVTALFTAQTSSFTVALTGNGTITSTSTPAVTPEIDCANPAPPTACSANFASGTSVSLTATPATGYSFSSWTAGPCNDTTAPTCAFVVSNTTATSATAVFTKSNFLLTVNRSGVAGGTVTGGGINCGPGPTTTGCAISIAFNTAVTLTETAPVGATFSGWTGTPTACTASGATCAFNMPAGAETVAATFATGTGGLPPVLTISKSHVGDFAQGDAGDTYTVTVSNTAGAGPTNGTVTVTDTVPSGLTLLSMAGTGWTCAADSNTCTSTDVLAAGASYPAITVTVAVASDATTPQVNSVTVSGGGSASATATDSTVILGGVSTQLIAADFNVNGEGDEDKQRVDGTSKPLQVTLTNTSSTQTVHVSGVTPTAPYTATTDCAALAPGGTCHLFIGFKPASVCQDLGDQIVTVNDDDPGGNFVMTIHGWGADSVIKVDDLTDSTLTPAALAQSLVGPGVAISNVKYRGALRAAGMFTSSSNVLGFTNGIVLSSGSARNVAGSNCEDGMSVDNGQPGDPDLNTIVGEGNTTNDAAVLEFDFVPTSSTISFQYVFGSEEYPDFVGAFNDVFGFFLTAPDGAPVNIALIPGTNLPVSINNVNDGNPELDIPPTNAQFYVNNQVYFAPPPAPLPPVDAEPNGLTTVLGAQATVTPGLTYHIKLAVADANDFALDSNVFVQAGSLSSANVTANPTTLAFGSQVQNTMSASQPVAITNVGTSTVTISSIVASTNFGETNNCPQTLVGGNTEGSSCVVNVTFTPTATGALTGTVTVTYTNAGSETPQTTTITLTGTGTAGAGTVTVTPSSLTFGSQALTTTSAAMSVTVMNNSAAAVNFAGFTTSGPDAEDFSVPLPNTSSGCSPTGTLAVGASCTINVLFTPQAAGTRTATLLIADNATGSPQTVALSGTGVTSSVIISIAPGGSSTATTVSGGTAYYGLTITGAPGVTGTVQLGCIPSSALITCTVIPSTVTLTGGTTEVAFAIQTFCQGTTTATGFVAPVVGGIGGGFGLLLVSMVFGGAMWTFRRNRRVALTFATLLLVALGSAACSNSLPKGPNGATPAGTYSLSLTTSLNGGPTQTLNNFLTLVVK